MRINLTEVEERNFQALPASRYRLQIAAYEMRAVKGEGGKIPQGTPMINWEFNVLADAKTGDTTYTNRKLWMNTILHEKVMFNLKGLMRSTGLYTDEQLSGEVEFEPEELIGSEVIGVVTQREYQGDMTNDIKRVLPLSEKDREEMSSMLP